MTGHLVLLLVCVLCAGATINERELRQFSRDQVTVLENRDSYMLKSGGLPKHETGPFTGDIEAKRQNISFSFPKEAKVADSPGCLPSGAIGVALNGVPIYRSFTWDWSDALDANCEERDECNGFLTIDGKYHYRGNPVCVQTQTGLVGVARDGYPIYRGYLEDKNGTLTLPTRTQLGLDECNGKDINGTYSYFVTADFPYTVGCFRGEVEQENQDDCFRTAEINLLSCKEFESEPGQQEQEGEGDSSRDDDLDNILDGAVDEDDPDDIEAIYTDMHSGSSKGKGDKDDDDDDDMSWEQRLERWWRRRMGGRGDGDRGDRGGRGKDDDDKSKKYPGWRWGRGYSGPWRPWGKSKKDKDKYSKYGSGRRRFIMGGAKKRYMLWQKKRMMGKRGYDMKGGDKGKMFYYAIKKYMSLKKKYMMLKKKFMFLKKMVKYVMRKVKSRMSGRYRGYRGRGYGRRDYGRSSRYRRGYGRYGGYSGRSWGRGRYPWWKRYRSSRRRSWMDY